MKITYMYCSNKNNARKKFIKSFKKLKNMNEREVKDLFKKVNDEIDHMDDKSLKKIYFDCEKRINNVKYDKKFNKMVKEVAITLNKDVETINTDNILSEDVNENIISTMKKISLRLLKILNSKTTKFIVFTTMALTLTIMHYSLSGIALYCAATGTMGSRIDTAFYYARMISGVVCFIFMALEIIQNAVNGDFRAIWYVAAKYITIITIIVSYKYIFDFINGLFN